MSTKDDNNNEEGEGKEKGKAEKEKESEREKEREDPADHPVIAWAMGSFLRSFVDALDSEAEKRKFLTQYGMRMAKSYPPRRDGSVLFPFKRIFIIAAAK